jgi:hypothetical protein
MRRRQETTTSCEGIGMTERGCYCELWSRDPHLLESQGVPRGFCGHCEHCGQPGHARHFPGAHPPTGIWCDAHYRRTMWLHPMGYYGRWVCISIVVLSAAIVLLLRQ